MYARGVHAGELTDGARQLALQCAHVIDFLYKIRLADLDLVKNFVADAAAFEASLPGDFQTQIIDLVFRHQNACSIVFQRIGNFFSLEHRHHAVGVFRGQVREQHSVFRPVDPKHERQKHRKKNHGHAADNKPLVETEFSPDFLCLFRIFFIIDDHSSLQSMLRLAYIPHRKPKMFRIAFC
jgi:hypothetical protein